MSKYVELMQDANDNWRIEFQHESGIIESIPIGRLSKEQAIRETRRRGYPHIRCWDKTVLAAIQRGDASIDRSVFQ
jgi:hypothetical protein